MTTYCTARPAFRLLLLASVLAGCSAQGVSRGISPTERLSLDPGADPGADPGTDPGADPGPSIPAPLAPPLLTEDFSTYTSTADFLADPRGIYADSEDIATNRMTLDSSVTYRGSAHSVRYDYLANAQALDTTISRSIDLRARNLQEAWVEAAIRFSPGFSLEAGANAGAALKLLHLGVPNVAGRFGLDFENGDNGSLNAEGPNDDYDTLYNRGSISMNTLHDGAWHVIRFHVRLGAEDFHEFWVDQSYQGSRTGRTAASSLTWVSLAKNLNQGPLRNQSLWWGSVKVWNVDPGWRP